MGAPLAPALADIFMNWLIDEVKKKSSSSFSVYRYVDDLFLAFENPDDIQPVFALFNSIHNNITFTKEIETCNQLSFLDVHILKTNTNIETKIFRKPTYSGLHTKWDSYVPQKYKKNLVSTLLYRAFNICNNYKLIHQEFQNISKFMQQNGFPDYFINNQIAMFLNKQFSQKKIQELRLQKTPPSKDFISNFLFLKIFLHKLKMKSVTF